MTNKRIEKATKAVLSEYYDSHLTIGITNDEKIIISENIINEKHRRVLISLLEDLLLKTLPPLD